MYQHVHCTYAPAQNHSTLRLSKYTSFISYIYLICRVFILFMQKLLCVLTFMQKILWEAKFEMFYSVHY